MPIAYLSQGRLYLHRSEAPLKEIESDFGKQLQQRRLQIQRKQALKNRGIRAMTQSPQSLQQEEALPEAVVPVSITSLCALPEGELIYSLEAEDLGGLFRFELDSDRENRLFHNTDFRVSYLDFDPEQGLIACTKTYKTGSVNLATMKPDAVRPKDITEGDSLDLAPTWVGDQALVYQSAGISRNAQGYISGRSPFSIEKLDSQLAQVTTLAEDPKSDLLGPQMDSDGRLYYIRRPYKARLVGFNLLQALKEICFVPFRLLLAILGFFNSFTMFFTGKPLITADTYEKVESQKKLQAWGEALSPEKINRKHQQDADAPALVPKTWELVRQGMQGVPEVLATSVLSYDLAVDGSVVYTNGSGVYLIKEDGKAQRLLVGKLIELVKFV
ncbi:MAG: hypothetical protein AAFR12_10810 [Cyanobacteria bacterium J06626_6]